MGMEQWVSGGSCADTPDAPSEGSARAFTTPEFGVRIRLGVSRRPPRIVVAPAPTAWRPGTPGTNAVVKGRGPGQPTHSPRAVAAAVAMAVIVSEIARAMDPAEAAWQGAALEVRASLRVSGFGFVRGFFRVWVFG